MSDWNPPETAPKDRTILANVGYPWAVLACWSEYAQRWVVAELQGNIFEGKDDPSWIGEPEDELLGWMDLPSVKP